MSPVRTRTGRITRLRSHHLLHHLFYTPKAKKKSRHPANASRIAKMLRRGHGAASTPTNRQENMHSEPAANLRRSMRKRRIPANLGYDSESDPEDCFQVRRAFRSSNSAAKNETKSSQDEQNEEDVVLPRREGLRPRRGKRIMRHDFSQDSEEDEQASSEGADREDEAADDPEVRDGDGEVRGERGREDREEEEDEEGEEREGRRRYALRNRTEVQRFSPQMEERVIHARPIAKSFQFKAGIKRNRDGKRVGSRSDKRHRSSRADDSDDSLLIDEMTHVPGAPWLRAGSSSGHPPLLFGGLDMSGFSNRGLNIAATGWGHQADHLGGATPGTGVQTTGLSHKGGADIQPVQVDESIGFDQVGGLSGYIQSLKEMVFFPLLYPKFFEIYGITPPRGVLLCGPPGTGKTLIARALASSASRAGQRVNFYMRKGADVLSKWVGEAERQLRMLFEEAQRNQPSIIFFDEIDGLAPVRSSKQEQIHNSIVSTLLALMDGLDARGQVVIIGATNRIDAIDGALRRPGRFDRELVFSLPDCKARAEILDIHTRKWQDCPSEDLRRELAAACVGYCGADLKALCTEAAIRAFRKKYPQVYTSDDQLLIDVDAVKVKKQDFFEAMSTITPAAQRGALVHSMPLSVVVCSCLERQLKRIMEIVEGIFPLSNNEQGISIADDDEDCDQLATLSTLRFGSSFPFVYRPRLLLCGKEGAGLEHLGPAVLHELERFPVHSLSLPSLLSDMGSRTPEEALVNIFREARRTIPAILYLPQLELWWETAHTQLRTVFLMLLAELPSNLPVLLLATSKVNRDELDEQAANIFGSYIYELGLPRAEDRAKFFSRLLDTALAISNEKHESKDKQENLPELPRAPKKERGMSEAELQAQADEEQHALRRLRMCLREVCNRLLYEKCFSVFHYPVMVEDAPDYHATVTNPMDVATLLQNVDSGHYLTRSAFLQDLELIPINAKAYHGDDYNGARIVSKAYALRDAAHGILSQMDKELVAQCDAIATRGGPIRLSGDGTPGLTNPTVSQPAHVTRASARLRGFQPEIDVSQTYEVHLRRSKRISDGDHAGEAGIVSNGATQNVAVLSRSTEPMTELLAKETVSPVRSGSLPQMSQLEEIDVQGGELSVQLITEQEKEHLRTCVVGVDTTTKSDTFLSCNLEPDEKAPKESHETQCRSSPSSPKNDKYAQRIDRIKRKFVRYTKGHGISYLEKLHADVCQTVRRQAGSFDRASVVKYLEEFVGILKSKADAGKCDEDSKS